MAESSRGRREATATLPATSMRAAPIDRSRSLPKVGFDDSTAVPAPEAEVELDHPDTQPLNQNVTVPQWQRDLAASRVGRHSRASSIFSTRTKLTVQSEDARSVEIQAGGYSFRISRDGVTDVTAPPPYSAQSLQQLVEESDEEASTGSHPESEDEELPPSSERATEAGDHRPPVSPSIPLRLHVPPGAIVDDTTHEVPGTGSSQVLEFPRRLINMFGLNRSSTVLPVANPADENAARALRRTQSDSSNIFTAQSDAQLSAHTPKLLKTHQSHHSLPEVPARLGDFRSSGTNSEVTFEQDEDDDIAAEMSRYFNRVMRDLDRDYRRKLHERDMELARSRELLNEKDIVYRQQLRDRDNTIQTITEQLNYRNETINQLKTQVFELEEGIDRRLEQARHQVESMWEQRWKEYENLLRTERKAASRRTSIIRTATTAHQQQQHNDSNDSHDNETSNTEVHNDSTGTD